MAMPPPAATARTLTLTRHPRSSDLTSLVTAITSCLETLNPQNPNPKHINPTHLNQFSPHLDTNLVIEVIKEQQPNPYQALFFFNWASNLNPNPNNYSHNHRCYVAIIDLLLSHSLFPIAKSLLEKHGMFSDLLVSKLIRAYGYSGDTKSAIFWFHKVKEIQQGKCLFSWNAILENVATHLSILKGLSVAGKSDEAIGYFSEMIRKGMKLDAKEHEVVITAYCKMRKPDEAISLLKEMQARGISRGVGSFNAVLRILVEIGELDKAVLLLKQVKNMGCLPNLVSYSTVICGLCRSQGRMQEVADLVDDMLQDGFEMDATLYSCLVGGFCEAGNEEMAMRAFYDSINKNYVINLQSFSFFVNLMCGKGKVIEAEQIFKDMCRRCSLVDVDGYQRVLDDQLHKHSGRR
ncbi:hypothetical protein Peur_045903 [Populus x canadensis]